MIQLLSRRCHRNAWTFAFRMCLVGLAQVISAHESRCQDFSLVPGVVVDYAPSPTPQQKKTRTDEVYIGSPSITIMPNGAYIASHDLFGSGTKNDTTKVFRSTNKGATWTHIATLTGQFWSTVFQHLGSLYVFGYSGGRPSGNIVIRRSKDGGVTWTTPDSPTTGLLRQGQYGGTPNAPVIYGGKLWIGQGDTQVMSAPVVADLLNASSWTLSNAISSSVGNNYFGSQWNGWYECQVVASPEFGVMLLPRIHGLPYTARIQVDKHAGNVNFDGFVPLPGGEKKFGAAYDAVSKKFFVLSNPVLPGDTNHPLIGKKPELIRNTAAVLSSKDLRNWVVEKIFLHTPNLDNGAFGEAFQYFNFAIDGNDLSVVSRTAFNVGESQNKPPRGHDSNLMTFHRIANFRNLSPENLLIADKEHNQVLHSIPVLQQDAARLPAATGGKPINLDSSIVPGVVIAHTPASSGVYFGSPGIAVLEDGKYLAKCDEFGPNTTEHKWAVSHLFQSTDHGTSWHHLAKIDGLFWASIFVHRRAVYLFGTNRHHGDTVILRSQDAGKTWTKPSTPSSGLLLRGEYHTAPGPVIVHGGRIWRSMEDATGGTVWGQRYRAFMMSAPEDADLLNAANWRCSSILTRNPDWLNGKCNAWLEGNAVVTPSGKIVNVLRVDYNPDGGIAATIHYSDDGREAMFDPTADFIQFPGGATKFTIRRDPVTNLYWALANYVPPFHRGGQASKTRNTLALVNSADLRNWTVKCIVLYHPDVEKHGFQYVDWLIENDDLIVAARTAYDDGLGGAHNQHDANFLTFHRVKNFRHLEMADSTPLFLQQARAAE